MENQINLYSELMSMPLEDYQRYYETIVEALPHHIKEMNMYFARIIDYGIANNDLVFYIDGSEGMVCCTYLIFKNSEIVNNKCDIRNLRWLDNWVFVLDGGYLFGNTFENVDTNEKIDFYVKATDVEFI